ncbi:MAG: Cna B-type domain-containing protein [Oscillibacter sp.]|nr:Cna B-type domain-containing protein [Oscillibacter sp.]
MANIFGKHEGKSRYTFKRALSLFMALVLSLGLVQVTAFATDESSQQIKQQGTTSYYDKDGKAATADNYAVSTTKTIAGTAKENVFDITLQVTTTQDLQKLTISPDAAVCLVMDASGSMEWNDSGKDTTNAAEMRITKAKAAAQNFLTSYVKDAGQAKRMVSVVEFGSDAKTVLNWTEANTGKNDTVNTTVSGAVGSLESHFALPDGHTQTVQTDFIKESKGSDWTKISPTYGRSYYQCKVCGITSYEKYKHNHCTYKGCTDPDCSEDVLYYHTHDVQSATDVGGTNMEGGLMLARNLVSSGLASNGAINGIKSVYVILLTDGVPTYHVANASAVQNETSFISGTKGGGYFNTQEDVANIPALATSIKDNATLYSLTYGMSETASGNQLNWSNSISIYHDYASTTYQNINTWLTGTVGVNHNFPSASGSDISTNLGSISTIITKTAQAWIVTDPMSSAVEFDQTYDSNISTTNADYVKYFNPSTKTLSWCLRNDTVSGSGTISNPFTYSMTYRVRLLTEAAGFKAGQEYATNGATSLKFLMLEDGEDLRNFTGEEVEKRLKTAPFTIPTVEGALGSLTFTKTDLSGSAITSKSSTQYAKFTLTPTSETGGRSITTSADANGNVTFTDVPSGFAYTLSEVTPPSGYQAAEQTQAIQVSHGNLSVGSGELLTKKDSAYVCKNTAEQTYTDLSISKSWVAPAGTQLPASITVMLQQDGADYATLTLSSTGATAAAVDGVALPDGFAVNKNVDTSSDSVWGYTIKKVPNNKDGLLSTTHEYTLKEQTPDGWTSKGDGTLHLTNITTATTDITVAKQWVSNISAWPENGITVELKHDGESYAPKKTVTLTSQASSATFEDVPLTFNGALVKDFSVAEEANASIYQQVSVTGNAADGFVITNAVTNQPISVSGTKSWKDDSAESSRPTEIYVGLFDGTGADAKLISGPVAVAANDGWAYAFTKDNHNADLTKYTIEESGEGENKQISSVTVNTYVVREVSGKTSATPLMENAVENGYKVHYLTGSNDISNVRTGTTSVSVSKQWIDVAGASHNGSDVTALLWQNGNEYMVDGKQASLTVPGSGDSVSFDELPAYDNEGVAYRYTVTEERPESVSDAYTQLDIKAGADHSFVFTNKLKDPANISISGTKIWREDGTVTHDDVVVGLYQRVAGSSDEWAFTGKTDTMTNGDTAYSFENCPKYQEVSVPAEPAEGSSSADEVSATTQMVELEYRVYEMNGESLIEAGGMSGDYQVSYSSVTHDAANGTFTQDITNTITGTVSVTVNKTWVDTVNSANRNGTVTLHRYYSVTGEDGTVSEVEDLAFAQAEEQTRSVVSSTKQEWSGLAQYTTTGTAYRYAVTESTSGYNSEISADQNTGKDFVFNVTNTLTMSTTGVQVTKFWVDGGDTANRPANITVYLYRNGEATPVDTKVVPATTIGNSQTILFDNLPTMSGDRTVAYTYTIGEKALDSVEGKKDYAPAVIDNANYTITNRLATGTVSIAVTKVWQDPVGTEHPDVTFTISAAEGTMVGGKAVEAKTMTIGFSGNADVVTPDEPAVQTDSTWNFSFTDMPKYNDNGVEILYTVEETSVEGGNYTLASHDGNIFINTINQPATGTTFKVTKVFANMVSDGVDGAAPVAPASIYVQLFADGQPVGDPVSVNIVDNIGTYDGWVDLDTYTSNGQYIQYTAKEVLPVMIDGKTDYVVKNDGDTVSYDNRNYQVSYGTVNREGVDYMQTITNTYEVPQTYYYQLTRVYSQYRNGVLVNAETVSNWVSNATQGTYAVDPTNYQSFTYTKDQTTVQHGFISDGSNTSVEVLEPNNDSYKIVLNYTNSLASGAEVIHIYQTYDRYTNATTEDARVDLSSSYNDATATVGTWTINDTTGVATFVPAVADRTGYTFQPEISQEEGGEVGFGETQTFTLYYVKTVDSTPAPAPIPDVPTPDPGGDPVIINPVTPPTADIPDITPPLAETPDEVADIPDEETPLAAAPAKTGDSMGLWIAASGISGIVLLWFALIGKKRREDDAQ